jgi:hypothetical protein
MGSLMSSATGVRLTLKFNFAQLIRNSGWSESYDLGYADIPTAVAAIANINAFIYDRCYCLGVGPYLASAVLAAYVQPVTPGAPLQRRSTLALPVPTLPAPGDAYNKAFNQSYNPVYLADFSPTVYYIALQTNLSGSPVYRRNCWMAGLPDGSDQTNSGTVTESNTLTAVQNWLNDLQNVLTRNGGKNSVSIRSIDRSNGNPIKQCTAWNIAVNTYTVPNHGFVINQPVLAEGMKTTVGGSCPRGRYLIATTPDINTISLQNSGVPTAVVKLGGFRAAIVTFNQIGSATGQGFTKRDKGRPSGLSVGRRRKSLISRT